MQPAGYVDITGANQHGTFQAATFDYERAARVEGANHSGMACSRGMAPGFDAKAQRPDRRVGIALIKPLAIGMLSALQAHRARSELDQPSRVHHCHAVGDLLR